MKKISLLLLLLAVACASKGSGVSILSSSRCELPCWNNITPGRTSQEDALQIIRGLDGVDQKSVVGPNNPYMIFSGKIGFSLYLDPQHKNTPTDGEIYVMNDKVIVLILTRNLNLNFGEMTEKIGEPENIVSIPFHGRNPVVMAIDSEEGVKFEFYAEFDSELQPETNIDTVMFFDPSHYEDLLDIGMFSTGAYSALDTQKIMYPWKGYGRIEELYPPRFP